MNFFKPLSLFIATWILFGCGTSQPAPDIFALPVSYMVGKNEPNHTAQAQLIPILEDDRKTDPSAVRTRRAQRRAGPRKTGKKSRASEQRRSGNQHSAPPRDGQTCSFCDSELISRAPSGFLRCDVCRSEWR